MLGRDERMQPGFVNFQDFAHGFGFARSEVILGQGFQERPTRCDFARTVAQEWL